MVALTHTFNTHVLVILPPSLLFPVALYLSKLEISFLNSSGFFLTLSRVACTLGGAIDCCKILGSIASVFFLLLLNYLQIAETKYWHRNIPVVICCSNKLASVFVVYCKLS